MAGLKTVCLDFDGVLNTYNGWKGEEDLFVPRPGAKEFFQALIDLGFQVVIHSTRNPNAIRDWLHENEFPAAKHLHITREKPVAIVYVDDRGLTFTGDFDKTLEQICNFKAHWEKEETA